MIENRDGQSLGEVIAALREASAIDTPDMIKLMKAAGLNPKTDFRGGKWRTRDFSELDLRGCNFKGSDLRGARFKDAQIENASFEGAKFHAIRITEAKNWRKAHFDADQWLELTRASLSKLPLGQRLLAIEDVGQLHPSEWVALIKAETSHRNARLLIERMNEQFEEPNRFAYSALISLASGEEAKRDFAEFVDKGGKVDGALVSAVIDRVDSFSEALELIDNAKAWELELDEHAFNSAFKKALDASLGDRTAINAAIAQLQDRGMTFGLISYNILIGAAVSFDEVAAIFLRIIDDGFKLRTYEINKALRTLGRGEVNEILQFAKTHDISLDHVSYNLIIGYQKSCDDAVPWLDLMARSGLKPDLYTMRSIFRCAKDERDAARGLTYLKNRGFDVFRREAVMGLAVATRDREIINWIAKMWESLTPPKAAMRHLLNKIYEVEPR